MIIVDNALKAREREGKPIRVGMVGAGFMGQGLTNQITHSVPGMRMAAVTTGGRSEPIMFTATPDSTTSRQPGRSPSSIRRSGKENLQSPRIHS